MMIEALWDKQDNPKSEAQGTGKGSFASVCSKNRHRKSVVLSNVIGLC